MKRIRVLVYDSGVGGINVLKRLYLRFPFVEFTYMSDSENAPYGNKKREKLQKICAEKLKMAKVWQYDVVVLACNTLSTQLMKWLKKEFFGIFFVGVFPCVEIANAKTLMISSELTASSDLVLNAKKRMHFDVLKMQDLIFEIEQNIFNLNSIDVASFFSFSKKSYDVVLLGCTHFCFIKDRLKAIFPNCQFFDGIIGTENHFLKILEGFEKNRINRKKHYKVRFVLKDKKRNYRVFYNLIKLN